MLQNRGYVELRAKALRPLERGQRLSTMLVAHLGQFVEPAFTSRLESDLDAISAGELDSTSFLAQWSVPSLPPLEPRALTERAARALTCDAPFSRWSTFAPACAAVAAIDTQTLRNQVRVRVSGVASPVRACRPVPVPEPATQRARACNPMCQVADQLAERLRPRALK